MGGEGEGRHGLCGWRGRGGGGAGDRGALWSCVRGGSCVVTVEHRRGGEGGQLCAGSNHHHNSSPQPPYSPPPLSLFSTACPLPSCLQLAPCPLAPCPPPSRLPPALPPHACPLPSSLTLAPCPPSTRLPPALPPHACLHVGRHDCDDYGPLPLHGRQVQGGRPMVTRQLAVIAITGSLREVVAPSR